MIDFDTFRALFEMLLTATSKTDESGLLTKTYYDIICSTKPSPDEVWSAISRHMDVHGSKFPSGHDLKQIIWDDRKLSQQQLPPAKESAPKFDPDQAWRSRLLFLCGIYKHQGDTPFYRGFLAVRPPAGVEPVAHEDVLGLVGEPVEANYQPVKPTTGFSTIASSFAVPSRSAIARQMLEEVE